MEKNSLRTIKKFSKRNFKENKLRNLFLILTIIITTGMLLSMNIMKTSIADSMKRVYEKQAGMKSHAIFKELTLKDIKKIRDNKEVDSLGYSFFVGNILDNSNIDTGVGIRTMDTNYANDLYAWPDHGTPPKNDNEIILEEDVLEKLGSRAKIGENVRIKWIEPSSKVEIVMDFVLAGYWEKNDNLERNYAWVSDLIFKNKDSNNMEATVMFKSSKDIDAKTKKIAEDLNLDTEQYNSNVAYAEETIHNIDGDIIPYHIAIILTCLSGMLILFNIMQVSVKLDIKLYGRMKTLGATSGQIKAVVYRQIMHAAIISIPIGVGIGYLLSSFIITSNQVVVMDNIKIKVESWDIILTIILMVLISILSCILPARMAGKVSPTELLNEDNSYGFTRKGQRHYPGIPTLFQLSLANLGRNKIRTIISVGFMTIGLVLLSCVHVIKTSFDSEKYAKEFLISDYSISDKIIRSGIKSYDPEKSSISEEIIKDLEGMDGITDNAKVYSKEVEIELNDNIVQNIRNYYEKNDREILEYMSYDVNWSTGYKNAIQSKKCTATVFGVEGIAIESLIDGERLLKGNFDSKKFASGNYVIAQGIYNPEDTKSVQPTYKVGDNIMLSDKEYEVMAIVEAPTSIMAGKGSTEAAFTLPLFIPSDVFQKIYPDTGIRKYFFNVNTFGTQNLTEYLRSKKHGNLEVVSADTLERSYINETRAVTAVQVMVSIMIFGVGVLNLINSMISATNVRRKEFAVMQSLGMTKKQLRFLLLFEGFNYAVITLILSYFLSILIISVGIKTYVNGLWSATFQFSLSPLLICTPLIIGITLVIPIICFNRIACINPINRLKNCNT